VQSAVYRCRGQNTETIWQGADTPQRLVLDEPRFLTSSLAPDRVLEAIALYVGAGREHADAFRDFGSVLLASVEQYLMIEPLRRSPARSVRA